MNTTPPTGPAGRDESAKQLSLHNCFVVLGLLVAAAALIYCASVLRAAVYPAPEAEMQVPLSSPTGEASSPAISRAETADGIVPAELVIPSLHIDSHIEKVGINAKGNIGTPSSFSSTAWYEYSPEPGDPGVALIDGHVNNGLGLDGVFVDLAAIQKGADIYVSDGQGTQLHFTVVSTSTAAYTSHLGDVPSLQEGTSSELALITCEGDWVPSSKTYDERIIVLADLVE